MVGGLTPVSVKYNMSHAHITYKPWPYLPVQGLIWDKASLFVGFLTSLLILCKCALWMHVAVQVWMDALS